MRTTALSEEGKWVEREPEDIPEPAKPKREKRASILPAPVVEDKTPRSDVAEDGILSCCLQSAEICEACRATIPVGHFYHAGNKMIYEEILAVHGEGKPVEIVTLSQHIIDKGLMAKIGGPSKLAELLNFVPTSAHFGYYRDILLQKFKLRSVIAEAVDITTACHSPEEDILEVAKVVVERSTKMISLFQDGQEETMDEAYQKWEEKWHDKAAGKVQSAMPSRWTCMNTTIGGIRPGYTIISGEYSSGKSVFVANILADACIKEGRPGILFSYECPVEDVISRLVCDIGGIQGQHVFLPDRFPPTPAMVKGISQALMKIRTSNLRIIHDPYLSAESICHISRKKRAKEGDLIVGVDYLQKLPVPRNIEKGANQERELATNSDTLQKLSKELNIPMLVLCQNNKDGSSRGSMSIEMDCDDCYRIEGDKGIWVRKNRNGAREFHLPLFLEKGMFRFQEVEDPFPS